MVFVDDGAGTQANANNQAYNTNERILRWFRPRLVWPR
jgi:hypothetical protein